ncbi:DUF72 domain-containing protein [Dyella sp. LX-1]|uniref:DUF72 domain-containing protein n=1 Tax=unclassified Dyella TaxID=2634549 RepID=UPI0031F308DB
MAKARIGISGWRYAPWRGEFYPDELPQREEMAYASRQLASIEINGSFYSLQRPSSYARWREDTPRGFVFAVKAPRYVTHMRRLRNAEHGLANFFASGVLCLREKLGPILWQLPPSLRYHEEVLEEFLAQLPKDTESATAWARRHADLPASRTAWETDRRRRLRHAMEVRHESFRDPAFIAQLRRHGVALVVADTAKRWPLLEDVTAGFMYLRLHGDKKLYASGYTPAALRAWSARLQAWMRGAQPHDARLASPGSKPPKRASRDVYVYFDNDRKVRAPFDAMALAKRMKR